MNNLSSIITKPSSKTIQIFKGCDSTGLPKEIVTKLFESSEDFMKDIADITKPKEIITSEQFKTSIATVFGELVTKENLNKGVVTSKFLDVLHDMAQTQIDSVNLMTIVQDVFKLKDLTQLNEEQKNLSVVYDEPVMLFEGLKTILEKNNDKWGSTYHLNNAYQTIMSELTKEVEQIQLSKKIHSTNNDFHILILNDMMSGNCSPVNKNVSAVKEMIPDLQTLVFDMTLIVAKYILENSEAIKYVKRQTYNDYIESANDLVSKMISSKANSVMLNYEKKGEQLDYDRTNQNLVERLAYDMGGNILKYPLYNQSVKGVFDMIHFIMSCSTELGMNLRSSVRMYNTKALELIDNIEHTKTLFRKNSF